MMRRLLEQTLRHALKRRKAVGRTVVALQTRETGANWDEFNVDGEGFAVRSARSPLEIRQILSENSQSPVVVLTSLESNALAQDILVRLVGGHVHSLSPWDRLADVLGLRSEKDIDSQLRRSAPDLAENLLAALPLDGSHKLREGRLSASRGWSLACEHVLGLGKEVSVHEILRLDHTRRLGTWKGAPSGLREVFLKRLELLPDGPAMAWMLNQVLKEASPTLIALGLVLDVVHSQGETADRDRLLCQGRLESNLVCPPTDAVREILSDGVAALLRGSDERVANEAIHQAQSLLAVIQGTSLAWVSDRLPEGFRQRWVRFAQSLRQRESGLESLNEALLQLERHQESTVQKERLNKAKLAVRLARWLALHAPHDGGLEVQVDRYLSSVAWVDRAVQGLAGGDASSEFQEAAVDLLDQVSAKREHLHKSFAQAISQTQGCVGTGMVAIENVIPEIVTPLMDKSRKVLLLVMDGLSWPCALDILEDIRGDWNLMGNEKYPLGTPLLPVGSSIPTVTEFARTSLLAGKACKGGQDQEREGFARSFPNGQLYHKGDLMDQRGQGLSQAAQDSIRKTPGLVALVLNAVDDQLKGSDQLHVRWNRESVPLLRTVLELAAQAGRIVVLASDHGHVPERGTRLVGTSSGGERWLSPERPCLDGEILLQGSRLSAWAGEVIVPWTERIRYAPVHNGYHGGITEQEWLSPLCVLAPMGMAGSLPGGWHPTELQEPEWWSLLPSAVRPAPVVMAPPDSVGQEIPKLPEIPSLQELCGQAWIRAVVESDVMAMQLTIAGRSAKKDMAKLALEAFDCAPDQEEVRITRARMALSARMPMARLQLWLAVVQQLLNVDSAECFGTTVDGQQLFLRPRLLVRQFGVENQV